MGDISIQMIPEDMGVRRGDEKPARTKRSNWKLKKK